MNPLKLDYAPVVVYAIAIIVQLVRNTFKESKYPAALLKRFLYQARLIR